MADDVDPGMTDEDSARGEVLCDIRGRVAILTLRRKGRSNAWGSDLARSLATQLAILADNDDIRACVVTGAGKNFCSGADLGDEQSHKVRSAGHYLKYLTPFERLGFDQLENFRKPVIAAVRGYAIGAGFMTSIHCDVIFAGESAKFVLPQGRIGIIPGSGGLLRLAQWIGRGRALELAMSGRPLHSEEARSIGLVTAIYPDDAVLEEAINYAAVLADMPPLSLWAMKESMRTAMDGGSHSAALLDKYRSGLLQLTRDADEAHVAWREHREGVYEID